MRERQVRVAFAYGAADVHGTVAALAAAHEVGAALQPEGAGQPRVGAEEGVHQRYRGVGRAPPAVSRAIVSSAIVSSAIVSSAIVSRAIVSSAIVSSAIVSSAIVRSAIVSRAIVSRP